MQKTMILSLGVLIGVCGILAIAAHLAAAAQLALYAPDAEHTEEDGFF